MPTKCGAASSARRSTGVVAGGPASPLEEGRGGEEGAGAVRSSQSSIRAGLTEDQTFLRG
jgi:hypothetical protein